MALKLYRRHQKDCEGKHHRGSRSYESEEGRRGWKRCHCKIHAAGTLAGLFRRQGTDRDTWPEAKALAAVWEGLESWDASPATVTVPPPKENSEPPAMTIQCATEAYRANRVDRHIAPGTLRKYDTFVKQLRAFAESKGYVLLSQFAVSDMDQFYGSWKDGIRAKAKKLDRLKGFFKFCVKRKWLTENPAADLEAPVGSSCPAHRLPFTDEELERIYEACDRLPEVRWRNWTGTGTWGGEDVKSIIMLLCWTGLRISDAALFDMTRVTPDPEGGAHIFLRTHKTKGALFTWVPDWLYERLRDRHRRFGAQIFACGNSRHLETVTCLWRRRINKAFDIAGKFACGTPTPHIFRHTFVRLLLQRGVSPRDVADLIGDTEDMVVKHYARWVPERQARLTNILREKLSSAPKPSLAVVGGRRAK